MSNTLLNHPRPAAEVVEPDGGNRTRTTSATAPEHPPRTGQNDRVESPDGEDATTADGDGDTTSPVVTQYDVVNPPGRP